MEKIMIKYILLYMLLPFIIVSQSFGDSSTPLALVNGTVIDGTGSEPIEDAVVIIENGNIVTVGTKTENKIPTSVKIINVQGGTIMPGVINTHVHDCYRKFHLQNFLQGGVTTIRDLGSRPELILQDKQLKDNSCARLIAAGPMVTAKNGYPQELINLEVNSPEDAEKKIEKLIDDGADLIKIVIEDIIWGKSWPMLSMQEIKSIVNTAHKNDRLVSAHVTWTKNLKLAIDADVDDVAHMIVEYLPEPYIQEMIKKNIYLVPTLGVYDCLVKRKYMPDYTVPIDNLRRFVRAGGKVALGNDYSGIPCAVDLGMPITEMKLMNEAGMTPMQIIIASTKNAAIVCGLGKNLGTLEGGKIADVIVIDGKPLDDIEVMKNVRVVIHNGELIINNL